MGNIWAVQYNLGGEKIDLVKKGKKSLTFLYSEISFPKFGL